MDKLLNAFDFRFSCRKFDPTKKIPPAYLNLILEAGRKSPSSFGLEPWHFVVIQNQELKEKLLPACFNQPQIASCSALIIVLYRTARQFTTQSPYLRQAIARTLPKPVTETAIDLACASIDHYFTQQLPKDYEFERWAEAQTYLASANMMTMASYHKIDSCAIGGFSHAKVMDELEKTLPKLSSDFFNVGLCLCFGYRAQQQTPQIRWQQSEVTTFI